MIARRIVKLLRTQTPHHARFARGIKQLRHAPRLPWLFLSAVLLAQFAAATDYHLETVAENLRWPWCVVKLPDSSFLITEREGRLLHLTVDGERRVLDNTPATLFAGQGGYFDVILHPQFADNRLLFLSYAEGTESDNGVAVFRAEFINGELQNGRRIFRARPKKITPQHYGGRMLFLNDGTLLLTSGEGFEQREAAQDRTSELGKVLRVDISADAPREKKNALKPSPYVYSLGHRNPQGLAMNTETGSVYLHEHGPRGGDELNLLVEGMNYGWPAVTHGVDYSGAYVSPFKRAPDMEDPLWTWVPSIAPSGMAWYNGSDFKEWRNSLLIGALVAREVRRLQLEGNAVRDEEALFSELGERIRDVRVFDDQIYLLTDSEDGRLLRVLPR